MNERPGRATPHVSADLTDRYAFRCRAIDVCGLEPGASGEFEASFQTRAAEGDAPVEIPQVRGDALAQAQALLSWLADRAAEGDPHVCTYSWAHAYLTGKKSGPWSRAFTREILDIATSTTPLPVVGLGDVGLDAFIVRKADGEPSGGHWKNARYGAAQWRQVLGGGYAGALVARKPVARGLRLTSRHGAASRWTGWARSL